MLFYAQSTGGFYDDEVHGSRTISIIQPGWLHPQIEVPNPQYDPESSQEEPTIIIDDPAVIPPTVEIDNPACLIPADAIEITEAERAALLAGESAGKRIVADPNGHPVLADPPAPSAAQVRAAAVETINATRDADLVAGVVVDGKRYHTDDRFLTELLGMLLGYQVGVYSGSQAIRTMDNQIEQLDLAQITALAASVGAHRKAVYSASWAAKDAL